jgi:cobalt-zinc-cadmium efflux system membrane fusion protein
MNARSWLSWSLLLVAWGCSVDPEEGHDDAHEAHDAHHDEDEAAAPGELVIGEDARRDLRITVATARAGTGDERATILGELTVDEGRYAEVGSPVAARIRALWAEPGDVVAAGAPLLELDAAELGRARADLLTARAHADNARASVERKRSLASDNVSAAELRAAEAELQAEEAEVAAAEASLVAYGAGPSTQGGASFTLRAPVGGVVLSRDARRGELVNPDQTLYRVADTSTLWLVIHAFERDALRVTPGVAAELTFAALPNRTFTGVVSLVGAEVDVGSRTVPVRLDVANPDGLLRPGMSGSARVPLASDAGVVAVPSAALQRLDDGWVVFVPLEAGRFAVRPVGRGRDLGDQVEVLSGLVDGETVVLDGAFLLKAEAEKQEGGGDAHGH